MTQLGTVTNKRISDFVSDVKEGRLVLRPAFQRRLVWTNKNKDEFLDTVLRGLPFPEIFIATGKIDPNTQIRINLLVDGQQRISTLKEYVDGSEDLVLKIVPKYSELSPTKVEEFLDYVVAVRDLGTVTDEKIKEIFNRINSTDFSLKSMEKLNAMYNGVFKSFCEKLSTNSFFENHDVFKSVDRRRMNDLTYCVILVGTLLSNQ